MKLSTVNIENFGARSNLVLRDLSEQLNVVYGPNGSGKSTIINFVRWVLYGNLDGSSRRYMTNGQHRSAGSLSIANEQSLRQTIHRYDDGSPFGKVTLTDASGVTGSAFERTRISGVDTDEYQNVFCLGFDQSPHIERMLQTASSRGFDFSINEAQMRRIQELTEQLTRQQSELHRFPHHDVQHLRNRREAIHREIANLEQQKRERQAELERQRREIMSEIDSRRVELQNLQAWLSQVETTIQTRRQQLESAAREAEQARNTWIDSRRQKVEDIDYQIQQWHDVLDSIRKRYNRLKTRLASVESHSEFAIVDDDSDLRYFMRTLGYRVDDIEQDFIAPYPLHERNGHDAHVRNGRADEHEYTRNILGTALSAMRDDVARLTETLRGYKAAAQHNEYENEIRHLRRCETELTELVESLSRQRDSLMSQPDTAHYRASSVIPNSPAWNHTTPTTDGSAVRPWYESRNGDGYRESNGASNGYATNGNGHYDRVSPYGTNGASYASASASQPNGYHQHPNGSISNTYLSPNDPTYIRGVDPVLEARLHHLYLRRDQVIPRVRELESQVGGFESQLSALDHRFASEDERIQHLRRELTQLEEQMRLAEEYDRMLRAVRLTEEEIARLRETQQPSGILEEASALLRRMSEGSYTGVSVSQSREITISDCKGQRIGYGQLSRGARDQAYLAINLALVSAYHRRGVAHPLVLNDIFINIDSERASATGQVLADFARHGHQLLVFTRHEHVMQHFGHRNAKIFTLGDRRIEQPTYIAPAPAPIPVPLPAVPMPQVAMPPAPTPVQVMPPPQPTPAPVRETMLDARYDWVTRWEDPKNVSKAPRAEEVVVRTLEERVEPEHRAPEYRAPEYKAPEHRIPERRVPERRTATPPPVEVAPVKPVLRLESSSTIEQVPTLDQELISQFREYGVNSVGQFLQLDPAEAARELSRYGVTPEGVYRWQCEVLLQVYAAVSPIGSQVLAECGIDDPEELSIADDHELFARVTTYLNGDQRLNQFSGFSIDRVTLVGWIETARRVNYQRRQERWTRYSRVSRARQQRETTTRTVSRPEPTQTESDRSSSRRPRTPRLKPDRLKGERTSRETTTQSSSRSSKTNVTAKAENDALRFYLELSDPVVDAPSIGPKTAERFHAIGVLTVQDLLEVDPDDAAAKINYRRITADVIREWQLQTSLVVQVPNLRGHDAQILVACEVSSPEELTRADASTLLKSVKRFCSTTEGKRILRNSKKPDLQEVTSWIQWAEHARELLST